MANNHNNPFAPFSGGNANTGDESAPWQEVHRRGEPRIRLNYDNCHWVPTRPRQTTTSSAENSGVRAGDRLENWCGVCAEQLDSKEALVAHNKQRARDHKHFCNLCKRVFKDENSIKDHVKHAKGHEVSCNLCHSAFLNKYALKNHLETNADDHPCVCNSCLVAFRRKSELLNHWQTEHTYCWTCRERFPTPEARDAHWKTTVRHKHCLQPGCIFDDFSQEALDLHLERDHFQCEVCKAILPSQSKLNLHLADHENNLPVPAPSGFACWGCGLPTNTISGLISHIENGRCSLKISNPVFLTCLGNWWYSPLFMDISFHAQLRTNRLNMGELQGYRELMDKNGYRPYICRSESCQEEFSSLSKLAKHWEAEECEWNISRLNVEGLQVELKKYFCMSYLKPE